MLAKNIRKTISQCLQNKLKYCKIEHKFYYGQGGQINLNLLKRQYNIYLQTVWEDHSFLSIDGLTGQYNFNIQQKKQFAIFNDDGLQDNKEQIINVSFKIPEDYTLQGKINGNIIHKASIVGKKIRSKPFRLEIVGKNNNLQLGDVKTQNINIINQQGNVNISSLTVQQGFIKSIQFQSKKLMTSENIIIQSQEAYIKSLIMFGKSKGNISSNKLHVQSISGQCNITAFDKIKIDRYYGGNIGIKCKQIMQKISFQTGRGQIQFVNQKLAYDNLEKILLGKRHNGRLQLQQNIVKIHS